MKELTQDIFKDKSRNIDWAGIDYDGLLSFGIAGNVRYTYGSERWRGFIQIGNTIENSGYQPLTSIRRKHFMPMEDIILGALEKYETCTADSELTYVSSKKYNLVIVAIIKHINNRYGSNTIKSKGQI